MLFQKMLYSDQIINLLLSTMYQALCPNTQRSNNPSTALEPVTIPALSTTITPDLPDRQFCPITALRHYLDRTNPDK